MTSSSTEGLHPDDLRRRLPSITTPLTPDTERHERLREAREYAAWHRENDGLDLIVTLDDEITRLDAVVTAVREVHVARPNSMSALHPKPLCSCDDEYPCATVRALDGGAS